MPWTDVRWDNIARAARCSPSSRSSWRGHLGVAASPRPPAVRAAAPARPRRAARRRGRRAARSAGVSARRATAERATGSPRARAATPSRAARRRTRTRRTTSAAARRTTRAAAHGAAPTRPRLARTAPRARASPRPAARAEPAPTPAATRLRAARVGAAATGTGTLDLAHAELGARGRPTTPASRRAGLLADVRELVVDPVARVARRDDLLQALQRAAGARPARIVSAAWIESASSWMSNGLTRQRELAELLVRARVLDRIETPSRSLTSGPSLATRFMPSNIALTSSTS